MPPISSPTPRGKSGTSLLASCSPAQIEALRTNLCEVSLSAFVRGAWPILHPNDPLIWGPHLDAICDHLEACTLAFQGKPGAIQRLIINIPPRMTKSMIVAVLWPAWVWVRLPWVQWLTLSHSESLAVRDSGNMRQVISAPWYQARWGNRYRVLGNVDARGKFENDKRGFREALGIGAKIVGKGGHGMILDDPNDTKEVNSEAHRESVIQIWKEKLYNRVNDESRAVRVLIQQRCHRSDLTGHILSESKEWTHLCLPNEFVEARRCVTRLPIYDPQTDTVEIREWSDPRKEEGELLAPDRLSGTMLEETKTTLGTYGYGGQYQQSPTPVEGGIIKKGWWRHYPTPASGYPEGVTDRRIFWDFNFKGGSRSDFVVGQLWGRKGADFLLLDQIRGQWDFVRTKTEFKAFAEKHRGWREIRVEAKANGEAILSEFSREVPAILRVPNDIVASGKEAQMHAVSPIVEAGNVFLPDPAHFPWVKDFIEEVAGAPTEVCGGNHDDQANCMTMAILTYRTQQLIPGVMWV